MVHAFLPSMVARKRGRIVSISSITAFVAFPAGTVYTSTKCGLHGFMKCLEAELLINDQEFVKFTTIFPEFINTRKELSDVLDKMDLKLSRLSPQRVADETVRGMLNNESEVVVSDVKFGFFMMRFVHYILKL
jgi:short-subunit dehydrogenase